MKVFAIVAIVSLFRTHGAIAQAIPFTVGRPRGSTTDVCSSRNPGFVTCLAGAGLDSAQQDACRDCVIQANPDVNQVGCEALSDDPNNDLCQALNEECRSDCPDTCATQVDNYALCLHNYKSSPPTVCTDIKCDRGEACATEASDLGDCLDEDEQNSCQTCAKDESEALGETGIGCGDLEENPNNALCQALRNECSDCPDKCTSELDSFALCILNYKQGTQCNLLACPVGATEPPPTDPLPTDPPPTEPLPTEPPPTDPLPTEPPPTDPVPTEPSPTDPDPTEPPPTDPLPTEPPPTDPIPTEPPPTDPLPTEPPPTDPLPTEALPTELPPTDPPLTEPSPTESSLASPMELPTSTPSAGEPTMPALADFEFPSSASANTGKFAAISAIVLCSMVVTMLM